MGILTPNKPYGILTNPDLPDDQVQDAPAPDQQAPEHHWESVPQPIPTIRSAPQKPVFQIDPQRQQYEQRLASNLYRQQPHISPTGFWGKAGHILGGIGSVLGTLVLGDNNMAAIGGTRQHTNAVHNATFNELGALQKQDQQEEQQFGQEQLRGAQTHEAEARANSLENPPDKPDKFTFQQTDHGLMRIDSVTGEAQPVTFNGQVLQPKPAVEKDTKITEDLQNQIDAANQAGNAPLVAQLQKRLRDLNPAAEQKFAFTVNQAGQKNDAADEKAARGDIVTHDKAYVQPANAVEKSYQMMDHAYQEFQNARKQGKVLPTGAQSMLALSTHLSTTFGNVKGARVTKDMIEHHLGARGISDSALVAVQRLTNGDTLSPAQWDAFHDLIRQSRNLSWGTAVKEAARKHIPVDFLPQDLQSRTVNGTPYDLGADGQFHKRVQ